MKTSKDDLLRYLWGCLTVAANDFAEGLDDSDDETLTTLLPVFDKIAEVQQSVERAYFKIAANPDVAARRDAAYLPVPEDLEEEIRAALSVLTSSIDAENVFEQSAEELKAFIALMAKRKSFGVGAVGVRKLFAIRARRLKQLANEVKGKSQLDYLSYAEKESLREEVRKEFDAKMQAQGRKLEELRDMLRSRVTK